ncbi:LysM peptidoglycan-binding domain-containing protein [Rhodanobacter sp. Si-c]|uniref:LysM peptidoglycan-binding domain-containing protein n=1 Tax=Rhodanobacter lycopersici TaxID=3162487 RepID=A0ABV3QAI0_9GAMM
MSRHLYPKRLLPLALSALLSACATTPPPRPEPAPLPAPSTSTSVETVPPAITAEPAPQTGNVWDRLRGSFAMADCDADPAVLSWARRYTQDPQRFEQEASAALPKLAYVQQVAAEHHVAGEFALLPWIESGFRPIPGRHGRPAGMWQIMPATAAAMGLHVDRHYDGRLDVQAAADAVMKLLSRYYDQFHDWRIADYAYNAGEYKTLQLIQRHGPPPEMPVIPRWPVHDITREHLTKLLAMACVVREPDRFHVSLPTLSPSQHLVSVPLPHSMPLARAADRAGMPLDKLKDLNAAFRNDIADTSVASYLMMPVNHAQQFRDALLEQSASASADAALVAGTGAADIGSTTASAGAKSTRQPMGYARTHRVKSGENLWQLARHYSVSVRDLQRWNHLQGQHIRPGQVIRVSAPH